MKTTKRAKARDGAAQAAPSLAFARFVEK